ncbi:9385_t:CDS:2 [Ambispora gerdemannii]|uniref:3'-5' exonuclease n=1 Tax=Ambispora gerdemannii TaxID=144530 RepID=A0A9N9B4R3_9GLOM|nr:9385_t:CDS:2 [Ambispora gerdemannii]
MFAIKAGTRFKNFRSLERIFATLKNRSRTISELGNSKSVIKVNDTDDEAKITHEDAEEAAISIEKIARNKLSKTTKTTNSIKSIKIIDNSLPVLSYKDDEKYKIKYISDDREANELIGMNRSKLFGFDIEWRVFPKPPSPVSLLQLCDASTIFLFHVARMQRFPRYLQELMENPMILKFGPNICADGKKLFRDYDIQCKSLVELGSLGIQVKKDGFITQRKVQSLRTLVEVLLEKQIIKDQKIQKSNWDCCWLSKPQIDYAANDATYLLAERIFALQSEQIALDPSISYAIDLCDIDQETTKVRRFAMKIII